MPANRVARLLSLGCAVAAVQMSVFVTVAGLLRPGYDSSRNWISQLSLGPGGWLADLNLVLCGLWLVVGAEGLRRRQRRGVAVLVAGCGACLAALAVLTTDAGLGYPPGVAPTHTTAGLIHQIVGIVLGMAGIAAAALLGPRAAARTVAAVMAVTFVTASVLVLLDAGGVLPGNPSGLLERVALFLGLGWIGVTSALGGAAGEAREEAGLALEKARVEVGITAAPGAAAGEA
ncbi:DUF998 domain-containing protein [Actinoplanes sp. LDG1-06]|uniref:DUF998 domain-containing protein n=1 Tax=Paractinoplanes ovalisporus TaxID=2810368 RepID=A0ABS2AEP0_9ACTN|nr:DUF998 domain-containing protein [Actinoplanes ovalisporus]MBM2618295.1 DUF998 domain-containing protein [Actinoplanes ovalisporus]